MASKIPRVAVPVLSNIRQSTFANFSINLEFFISIPLPVAAAKEAIIGAELTSIKPQGQLTTKTATALEIS